MELSKTEMKRRIDAFVDALEELLEVSDRGLTMEMFKITKLK